MVLATKIRKKRQQQRPPEDFFLNCCDDRGIVKLNLDEFINKGSIGHFYRIDKGAPFATGLYAQVKKCRSLREIASQQKIYAAKYSPRRRPGQSFDEDCCIENLHEIALLSQLKHPHVVAFKDAFILDQFIVTIMELAPGGDLQSIIDADLVPLEKDTARYIYQLLEALRYLHARYIAHLDIKPQNLLLMGEFPACDIKLCDFEISRIIKPGQQVREILGTPDYVAPEILLYEPLSVYADVWSVGILTYVLLTGFSPFGGDTDQETYKNIMHEPIDFPDELFDEVSPAAIDFIRRMTVKSPKNRPTASDILSHKWLHEASTDSDEKSEAEESSVEESPTNVDLCTNSHPKKRTPRKAMASAGKSTASILPSNRRSSARSILRACKSAYDLSKMGGKTKSREALVEKMKLSGESSKGNKRIRKNLSKSREQLWESKIQLSKSCEKINNFHGSSSRWASIANFPSLDNASHIKSESQESVVSIRSTISLSNNTNQVIASCSSEITERYVVEETPTSPPPASLAQNGSSSTPNTPPIPNFDLSSPQLNVEPMNVATMHNQLLPKLSNLSVSQNTEYPSLPPSVVVTSSSDAPREEQEPQKTVAELIATFGGRVASSNNKKIDFKNQFEPILEVEGREEEPISFGDGSDNSSSGVSSIVASASSAAASPTTSKEPFKSYPESVDADLKGKAVVKGNSTSVHTKDESRKNRNVPGEIPFSYSSRRCSASISKPVGNVDEPKVIKGILKNANRNSATAGSSERRGSYCQSSTSRGGSSSTSSGPRRPSGFNIPNKNTASSAAKIVTPKHHNPSSSSNQADKNKKFHETKLENLDIVQKPTRRPKPSNTKIDSRPASFIFVNLNDTQSSRNKKREKVETKSGKKKVEVSNKKLSKEKTSKAKSSTDSIHSDENGPRNPWHQKNEAVQEKVEIAQQQCGEENFGEKLKSLDPGQSIVNFSDENLIKENSHQSLPCTIMRSPALVSKGSKLEGTISKIGSSSSMQDCPVSNVEPVNNANSNGITNNASNQCKTYSHLKTKTNIFYNKNLSATTKSGSPVVLAGSIGRAKQRLLNGGPRNPRRGSVPDF